MSNTQADRLVEQIRSIADKLPNIADCDKAQIGLYKISRELAALAKQQATQPSAPQAAGAGSVAWARDWLIKSADSLDKAAARLRTWPDQEQEARARELAAVQIRGLLQLLNVEQMLAASTDSQVREQAALPAEQQQQEDEELCGACGGSGTVRAMTSHLGHDDYEYDEECAACNGSGSPHLKDALESVGCIRHTQWPSKLYMNREQVMRIVEARAILAEAGIKEKT